MGKYLELKYIGRWEYVSRVNCAGAVIILVYHRDRDQFLCVEQYRPPVQRRVLEFPAGLIEDGESPVATALRELAEEAGISAAAHDLIELGYVFSSVGMTDELVYLYAIEIDSQTQVELPELQGAEIEHDLQPRWVGREDILHSEAAKALSILLRFEARRRAPELRFNMQP